MRPRVCRGAGVVELLIGEVLGFVALAALTATVAAGGRLLAAAGRRGEVEDTAQLAIEAFTFDARRAGYDPAAAGIEPVAAALEESVTFSADLDGDGALDLGSEEHATYVCNRAAARLSRVIGAQSLPLADGVVSCVLRYLDAAGTAIAIPSAGLGAPERARVRSIVLDLAVGAPGLPSPAPRRIQVALRGSR